MKDPLTPPVGLLCKLGNIVGHADELLSPHGHHFDKVALDQLLKDADVRAWMKSMSAQGLISEPRNKR